MHDLPQMNFIALTLKFSLCKTDKLSQETKSKQRRDNRSVIWSRREHIISDRSAFKTQLIVTSDMAQRSAHSEPVPVISQKTRIF